MAYINHISKSGIFFSCTENSYTNVENGTPDNALVYICSGSMTVKDADKTYTIREGETVLFYRDLLAKFTKHPSDTAAFKSISIVFSQPFLQKFYLHNKPDINIKPNWEIKNIPKHPLLISLFDSILPYYEIHGDNLPPLLADIKLQEAITILRAVDISTDSILSNFAQPGKIDLAGFMHKNYMFNTSMERFAWLAGRSLATFKRDFQKTFNSSPQKWLLEKRLKQAHYLISEQGHKPSDAYLEVGFENLSHFTSAFKQYFGYTPSATPMSH
jgi:AraC-like DNA-binding protein